jgi:hypothetical protein
VDILDVCDEVRVFKVLMDVVFVAVFVFKDVMLDVCDAVRMFKVVMLDVCEAVRVFKALMDVVFVIEVVCDASIVLMLLMDFVLANVLVEIVFIWVCAFEVKPDK